jgi:hypothetical protein
VVVRIRPCRLKVIVPSQLSEVETASIGGGGGYTNSIAFSLSFLEGDQNLSALIAQEQTVAPLLDFTAFSETDTITGAIAQAREAEEDAITGFYRVLDIDGSVLSADGTLLTPGDSGYAAAALRESNQIAAFSNLSVADAQSSSTEFSLQNSGIFAPFSQVNGHTFFAFSEANADGLAHFHRLQYLRVDPQRSSRRGLSGIRVASGYCNHCLVPLP